MRRAKIDRKWFVCLLLNSTLLASCESVNDNLYGNWAVFEVFYYNEDITGINRDAMIQSTLGMEINKSKKIISLPIDANGKVQIGHFRVYRKKEYQYMEIFDADDSRFNGLYLIHLEALNREATPQSKNYRLILESKNMYLYAEKFVTSLP